MATTQLMTDAHTAAIEKAGPCIMVIFGAAGDLTKRKLFPALLNLCDGKMLSDNFAIIGIARADKNTDQFREELTNEIAEFATGDVDPKTWSWFVERTHYLQGNFDDPATYAKLKEELGRLNTKFETQGNYLFYLATAPEYFSKCVDSLAEVDLLKQENDQWRRVVIEKPFGHDLQSAQELNRDLLKTIGEDQVFRIDHYLGKETVQNIMVFRFANGFFEPLWNSRYIDHVQITVSENVGVEMRGNYYDHTGALRDMISNHLLQLVALTAMEPPTTFGADDVRYEKAKVINAVQPITYEQVNKVAVRGQYDTGKVKGKDMNAYRNEPRVAKDSNTDTFVALKLVIDNWRWAGVPFYLRTGKGLGKRVSEIAIQFKQAPYAMFRDTPVDKMTKNFLVLRLQPEEEIKLEFEAKIPGPSVRMAPVSMHFDYKDFFGAKPSTGYETLIFDVMLGDATLFNRADNVEACWKVVQPVLDNWGKEKATDFPNYTAGSTGPKAADELIGRDGRKWRDIIK
jgi:glucose-6-phosphate 1-dehydrogenase